MFMFSFFGGKRGRGVFSFGFWHFEEEANFGDRQVKLKLDRRRSANSAAGSNEELRF